MKSIGASMLCVVALTGCASIPRPTVLAEVDRIAKSKKATESRRSAPQAYAHAQALREKAGQAHESGDSAAAQIFGETAIAAHEHSFVLARLAEAERRRVKAEATVADHQEQLARLDGQQQKYAAEADAYELRSKVERDAIPRVPNPPTDPKRERARLDAARGLASQARLLCVAARLLSGNTKSLTKQFLALDQLSAKLRQAPRATPIDDAISARAHCLSSLTAARRPAISEVPEQSVSSDLLTDLSQSPGLDLRRDDRGVVITLRDTFRGRSLNADAAEIIARLGAVSKAHPNFPILVVLHTANRKRVGMDRTQLAAVTDALKKAGAVRVEAQNAHNSQPVAVSGSRRAARRNTRVEVVFISPAL